MDRYDDIVYTSASGVAQITLNRPEKLNALRFQTYEELADALWKAEADQTVGVVVIRGNGRAFCAGGDLEMAQSDLTDERSGRLHYFRRMIAVSHAMTMMGKPVICAVQGPCVGGGAEMATFADFIVAGESAYFLFNGTAIGGCSWWGGPQLLPLQVGLRRAEQMMYLSERVHAREAAEIGLINKAVPDGELDGAVDAMCQRILDLSEDGLRLTKAAIRSVKEAMLGSMTAAAEMNVAVLGNDDLHSAFDAVRGGAKMSWRDRRRSEDTGQVRGGDS